MIFKYSKDKSQPMEIKYIDQKDYRLTENNLESYLEIKKENLIEFLAVVKNKNHI